jgi:heme-degrading monooxygenase HmoA
MTTPPADHAQQSAHNTPPCFIVSSDITIDEAGMNALEAAFAERLHEVDDFPGFQRLEVWRDTNRTGTYTMVTWWNSADDFTAYMRSDQHRRSHARIPNEPTRPCGAGVRRYEQVATDRGSEDLVCRAGNSPTKSGE